MLRDALRSVRDLVRHVGWDIAPYGGAWDKPTDLGPEFRKVQFAGVALQNLLGKYSFETVLDIGCGSGSHAEIFMAHGKKVTALDYGESIYFQQNKALEGVLIGDFNTMKFDRQFDCVWAAHVLEHQLNVGLFLAKIFEVTKDGGVVCITVPPLQHQILGGHLTFWNAGLLLYNLVLAGFDCREARIRQYGYNISVIIQKKPALHPSLVYDNGDVNRIAGCLPPGLKEGFSGDIWKLNWD